MMWCQSTARPQPVVVQKSVGKLHFSPCDLKVAEGHGRPAGLHLPALTAVACRMTATQIASADHLTWVNHQLMMHGRETEARSHNLITVGDPDIAFQVCLDSAAACTAMLCAAEHWVALPLVQRRAVL